jgi:hypothetical protein
VPFPLIVGGSWTLLAFVFVWFFFQTPPAALGTPTPAPLDLDACVAELDGVLHHLSELAAAVPDMREELNKHDCFETSRTHLADVQSKVREALGNVDAMYECLRYTKLS